MKITYKIILGLAVLFLLFPVIYFLKEVYTAPGDINNTKIFTISSGEGAKQVSINLEKEGIIKDHYAFLFYVYAKNNYKNIQAGDYLLSSGMNIADIVKMIVNGNISQRKITIPEGWDLRDIADYFQSQGISTREDFYSIVGEPTKTDNNINISGYGFPGKPSGLSLEGYLFPDTYYVGYGDNAETIIKKTLENFDQKITTEMKAEAKAQGKSTFEILTMASLIEKEVKTYHDKQIVSGILWNRLNKGMPLQVDSTVLYANGGDASKVYTDDTKIDSSYNTYKYKGLPLGPICNPGIDSVEAALNPITSNYYYYLSAPDGTTHFSKTLEEHNINKVKYLK